ncbi:MAG TPA: hypothetical protein VJK05_00570, partial [archaeon]|nr:hypothetical protein [archaeon]
VDNAELYPFIFTSQEEWQVDICMQVPQGYIISAAEDELVNIVSTNECISSFVAGESKVYYFTLQEIGSPEPNTSFNLTAKHKEKTKKLTQKMQGMRQKTLNEIEREIKSNIREVKEKRKLGVKDSEAVKAIKQRTAKQGAQKGIGRGRLLNGESNLIFSGLILLLIVYFIYSRKKQ